jgi:hypothetical protein
MVRGSNSGRGRRFCSSPQSLRPGSGSHPAPCSMGFWSLFREAKRPGRKVDHAHPSSAQVKNKWSYVSTPPYPFKARPRTTLPFTLLQYAEYTVGIYHILNNDNDNDAAASKCLWPLLVIRGDAYFCVQHSYINEINCAATCR